MSPTGQSADGPGGAGDTPAFRRAFYDRTSAAAFGLALHITGDRALAAKACEQAFVDAWGGIAAGPAAAEQELMERVRRLSFGLRQGTLSRGPSAEPPPAYHLASIVRASLAAADPLGRRAVELAYFGGMSMDEVSETLGEPVEKVRAALRTALLQLAAATRDHQESVR